MTTLEFDTTFHHSFLIEYFINKLLVHNMLAFTYYFHNFLFIIGFINFVHHSGSPSLHFFGFSCLFYSDCVSNELIKTDSTISTPDLLKIPKNQKNVKHGNKFLWYFPKFDPWNLIESLKRQNNNDQNHHFTHLMHSKHFIKAPPTWGVNSHFLIKIPLVHVNVSATFK